MVIRASVSITSDTVYTVSLASVAYVKLDATVTLDTTGRFRYIQELVAVVDGRAYTLTKPLSDTLVPSDAISVAALKVLADGFAMNDGSEAVDGSVYSMAKGIQNVVFVPDATTQSAAKALADTATPLDVIAKSLSRPLADVFNLADDETVAALKGISDSITMQDTIDVLLTALRDFSEPVSVDDLRATVFTPATKAEQITIADNDTISYQKNLADSIDEDDDTDVVDGLQHSLAKGIGNQIFVAEAKSLIFATSRVESVSVADAGLMSVQDYADLSYFAEDYVGFSQSF